MANLEPPSFSLGLDFDLDTDTDSYPNPTPLIQPHPSSPIPTFRLIDDDDFSLPEPIPVPNPTPTPHPSLKRLRRESGPNPATNNNDPTFRLLDSEDDFDDVHETGRVPDRPDPASGFGDDDDIEEFSSQEDPFKKYKPSSQHPNSGCSTSKFSLHGHRVLTTQSTSKCKMTQNKHATDFPFSNSTKANTNTFTFPKITASPLRKFQLIDSDSDYEDPCASEHANTEAKKVNLSSKRKLHNPSKNRTVSREKKANASETVSQEKDLWDDFYTEKKYTIPTPALDEVCEEYFRSVKDNRTDPPTTNVGNCSREIKDCVQTRLIIDNEGVHCKLDDPIPPSHCYFYGEDLRIRNLVRNRLPFFFPLGATRGEKSHSAPSVIDYRSQFNQGESSKPQAAQRTNTGMGSKSVKKNLRKSNFEEELPQDSRGWKNPRSSVGIPKDAGKRRVHAVDGQSAGHWFTSPEGKKVYISKTGEELTGRSAYVHYRKESGKAFKRSGGKKKSAGKKKSVGKSYASTKRR